MSAKIEDLTGRRFGKLLVLHQDLSSFGHGVKYICKCECGNITSVYASNLYRGLTTSCGCKQKSILKTHGLYLTKIYNTHKAMISRCYNPNNPEYKNYGGHNPPIKIADIWYTPGIKGNPGVVEFYRWSYEEGGYYDQPKDTPSSEILSIERIDVNKGYSPDNCKWIPRNKQNSNKHDTIFIWDGEEKLARKQFSDKYGLYPTFVKHYIGKGYTYDQIIHYAKYGELLKQDKNGIWRNKDGWQRLMKHYDQTGMNNHRVGYIHPQSLEAKNKYESNTESMGILAFPGAKFNKKENDYIEV